MDWVDILRKATLISIGFFCILTIITFVYSLLRWTKNRNLTKFEYIRFLVRLAASLWLALYCFMTVWLLIGKPLSWECPTLFPLFIILNISQFLNLTEQWVIYYRKDFHLTNG